MVTSESGEVLDRDIFCESESISVVDARWLMAFAAAIGDTKPIHLDTAIEGGLVAHPLFSVCVEWPALLESRRGPLGALLEGARTVVHSGHSVTVHRLVRPGERLVTSTRVTGIETKNSGVLVHQEFQTLDTSGLPVATTFYTAFALGARFHGSDVPSPPRAGAAEQTSDAPQRQIPQETSVVLTAGAAHVYTEGSRIYNPIHTDRQVALDAGLERPILHGTATLAMAVTALVDHACSGDPSAISSISGRFSAPVTPPCMIRIRWWPTDDPKIPFCVLGPNETVVISAGSVTRRTSESSH